MASLLHPTMTSLLHLSLLAAVFNLNHPAHVLEWHFIKLSLSNVVVIGVMLLVFVLAIALPFPGASRRRQQRR